MEYLDGGISYYPLDRKYHIPGDKGIKSWVAAYRAGGLEKILRSRQNQVYPFKNSSFFISNRFRPPS